MAEPETNTNAVTPIEKDRDRARQELSNLCLPDAPTTHAEQETGVKPNTKLHQLGCYHLEHSENFKKAGYARNDDSLLAEANRLRDKGLRILSGKADITEEQAAEQMLRIKEAADDLKIDR